MLTTLFNFTLTFIIFFSPLAFGGVHLWSGTLLQSLALTLLFIYTLQSIKKGVFAYRKNILNAFFLSFIIYIVLQLYLHTTKASYRTSLGLRMSLVYFALFLSITNMTRKKSESEAVISKIVLAGVLVSLLGIFQKLLGADKIYWVRESHGNFFGPFINENHFASYISITAFVALGSIFATIYGGGIFKEGFSLRQKIISVLDVMLNRRLLFTTFAFFIMVMGIFLSKSRSGIFFFVAACIFFSVSFLFRENPKKAVWFILPGFFTICLLLSWIGADRAFRELATIIYSSEYVGRMAVFEEARRLLADYPVWGIGIGAFSTVFPMYRTGFEITFHNHLHNDIFQLLIETGVVAFIGFASLFLVFLIRLFAAVGKTKSAYKYYTLLGILASFVYLGLHSLVDFPMRINAVSSLFVILLSLASIVMHFRPSRDGVLEIGMHIQKVLTVKSGKVRGVLYLAAITIFIYLSFGLSKPFIAYVVCKNANTPSSFKRAIGLDPKNSLLYYEYSQFLFEQYRKGLIDNSTYYDSARSATDKAIRLNPYNSSYIIARGWLEFRQENYEKAGLFLKEASLLEPRNPRVQMAYAYLLFWHGLNENDTKKKDILLKKGLIYYETAEFLSKHVKLYSIIKNKPSYEILKEGLKKEGITVE